MGNVKLPIESGKYFKERTEFVNYVFIKKMLHEFHYLFKCTVCILHLRAIMY